MMTYFLKRVLPFILTLMVGAVLGNLFGSHSSKRDHARFYFTDARMDTIEARQGCPQHRHWSPPPPPSRSIPASISFKPVPVYTEAARKHQLTGFVSLLVELRADGTVGEINVVDGADYGMTEEAVKAARRIEFTPGTFDGEAVSEVRAIDYVFPADTRVLTKP